jgi:hypothetical protein
VDQNGQHSGSSTTSSRPPLHRILQRRIGSQSTATTVSGFVVMVTRLAP